MDLRKLFDEYGAASFSGEPSRVAAFYSPQGFLAAGPQGSAVFPNDSSFLDWLASMHEFNRNAGMQSIEVEALTETLVAPGYTLARVTWAARFEKTGNEPIRFDISYLLQTSGEPLIVGFISHEDQTEAMKRYGLV